ncbi:hypothetical protein [Pseudonocardia asaccharolytica]|uniref:MalT-like TPR region domain-containing protein n=1 Tax=Pseudonocardia asaccharolytica DSM 44247 = NBRC 16224 TaxID=1123024 RepID=A0A511CW10_9PSEU|nr:hypothetical protein [Pseudonocardia asaccharolytica]GEL16752.1 hypothetical protein PA7_05890 [Pseudonocardia asaccharolytica DSM 44247 = NBRC 16224]
MPDPVAAGWAALAGGRWQDAAEAFTAVVAQDATAEALHGLGTALWWLGQQRRHVELLTAAFAGYRRNRDHASAVLVALDLCCTFKSNYGDVAVAAGWLRRAERLASEGVPRAWVQVMRAYLAPADPGALDRARSALDAGVRHGDTDLELCALSTIGHALVLAGRV